MEVSKIAIFIVRFERLKGASTDHFPCCLINRLSFNGGQDFAVLQFQEKLDVFTLMRNTTEFRS